MPENRYKEAMDKVRIRADFETRVTHQLEARFCAAADEDKPKRRGAFRIAGALVALAAALTVALITPGMFAGRTALPAPETVKEADATARESEAGAALPGEAAGTSANALTDMAAAPLPAMYSAGQAAYNTDEYSFIQENGFQYTTASPLSTFAADVDTASYANVRRMLLEGTFPPADAVRIEEMINYFRYDYPQPRDGEPFSVTTEIAPCPWNGRAKLLMVGLQARKIDESTRPACNLVFLIDVSGSMDGPDRLGLAQRAFLLLTEQLKEGDRVSIVTYAGTDSVVLEGAAAADRAKIASAIENLMAGGSTAGSEGIKTAYDIARAHFIEGGNNRVILATDGDLNVGVTSEGELTRLIEKERERGVFLSVMGFGSGNYKDNKLEALADHGNGNYSYIDSDLEARKVLVEEMGASFFTVCKDVKLQLEFNPDRISEYRLIGYENRALDSRDFADDTKDGGEIGAGHRVTALYEIIEADGTGPDGGALKYQTSQSTGSSEYLTVSVRFKAPDGDVSKCLSIPVDDKSVRAAMSDNLAFASAVAETGMLLRGSEYAGSASYSSVSDRLAAIPGLTADPYKDEFAYLVRQLARGRIG